MLGRASKLWLFLLLVVACSGGTGGGGCGGCGGCMEAIPGGFPVEQRVSNSISAEISEKGFELFEGQLSDLISQVAGQELAFDVPCTEASQNFSFNLPVVGTQTITIPIFVCDMNNDGQCTAADDDPAVRVDEPGHGKACSAAVELRDVKLTPKQSADGWSTDLQVKLEILINTGRIHLRVKAPSPVSCQMHCGLEFDTDFRPPDTIPAIITLNLKVDRANGDILAIDFAGIEDITSQIQSDDLRVDQISSNCGFGLACNIINNDFVKDLLVSQLTGMIEPMIRDTIDGFRCMACDPAAPQCPANHACNASKNICETHDPVTNKTVCAPALLGMEGRARPGEMLAGFGGDPNALLDVSVVAGGVDRQDKPTTRENQGGLQLGFLGGTDAPERSDCVGPAEWTRRLVPPTLDFKAEAGATGALADYQLGIGLSDAFLDKAFYDAWAAGLVCLSIGTESVSMLSTGLFSALLRTLGPLTQNQDVPMLLRLHPRVPPDVVIGKGSTKQGPDGELVPDDPLLTINLKQLQIDFYALIEGRQFRLFTLVADVQLAMSLDFDPVANTVTPVLASLDSLITNPKAMNNEILGDTDEEVESLISSVLGLVQPMLAGALGPIALPEVQGFKLKIQGARGAVPLNPGPGYEHLALFAKLELAAPQALVAGVRTEARAVETFVPSVDELRDPAGRPPHLVVEATAHGVRPVDFQGHEFSWRIGGGLWSPWQRSPRIEIAAPVLKLQRAHDIEVRARHREVPESVDRTPARLVFVADYEPPALRLELDAGSRQILTVARDAVTPAERLAFRYRVAGGDWSAAGPARAFDLDELGVNPSLEVLAVDEAGHEARATFGIPAAQLWDESGRPPRQSERVGCAQAEASILAAFGLLLVALRRRRAA